MSEQELKEIIKKHLSISVDTSKGWNGDKKLSVVLLWDDDVISHNTITIENAEA
jgi:hypothetical protein